MKRLLASSVVAVLLLAGCSSKKTTDTPSSTATGAPAGDTVKIEMADFKFVPTQVTASTAQAIELDNTGAALHNFTIEGSQVNVDVKAGETQRLEPPAPVDPGTYTFFCEYHRSQGMEGTITVVAG
jgi:plastocyanin